MLLVFVIGLVVFVALVKLVGGLAIYLTKTANRAGVIRAPWWLEPVDLVTKPIRLLDSGAELVETLIEYARR